MPLIFGEFKGKIKILNIHISSVGNLELSVEKLQLPAPNLLTCDSADYEIANIVECCYLCRITLVTQPELKTTESEHVRSAKGRTVYSHVDSQ